MIDIEALAYTRVSTSVKTAFPTCVSGTTSADTPASFPFMLFSQKDNSTYKPSIDSGSKENHVNPMIQIDVYSNNTMYEAKQIMAVADAKMLSDGWTRTYGPNPMSLVKPYRLTARYQGVVKQTGANSYEVYGI